MDKSIVIGEVMDTQVSPEQLKAVHALRTAKIPKEHIKKHPGKGGKTFSFVPHTIATDTMNDALGMNWDWEILDYNLYPDKSAVARGKLTVHWTDRSGQEHERVITELGGKETMGENSVLAYIVLGAASRALLRCMLRMFGYGRELYPDDEGGLTIEQAWATLEQYAKTRRVSKDELVAAIKAEGITKTDLVDRFEEAYALIQKIVDSRTKSAVPAI
jgi:hypothetical protein